MKAQLIDVCSSSNKSIQIKFVEQKYLTAPLHFHEMCELVYIQKGYGKRIVGDHVRDFMEGDLVLLGPGLPHIWLNDPIFQQSDDSRSVSSIVIYFSAYLLSDLVGESNSVIENLIVRAQRGLQFYGETQQRVVQSLNILKEKNSLTRISSFFNIIDILLNSGECNSLASIAYKNSFDKNDTDRMSTLYQYLNKNFKNVVSLSEAAKVVNMSPSTFCRFFKSRTGKPFSLFLNELRIGHACKLLIDGDQSITSIAFECGYQNLTNFNKFFRRVVGKTASQYKKETSISIE